MHPAHTCTSAEVWLAWFEATRLAACRAHLCKSCGLEPADADAMINAVRWQVYRHWATIEHPLAYFWQTLRRAVQAQHRRLQRERQQQEAYVAWWSARTQLTTRVTQQVADVLEETTPHQRQLLWWFVLGYDDAQVAAWLQTTPAAIRVRRHTTYRTLRDRVTLQHSTRRQAKRCARQLPRQCGGVGHPPCHASL